ncbi:hypothetical protein [Thauera sp. Sel9]|uniref:hypothetical protein n=1 Tax=Thauera sp. Sel9 TaxID=2974299 RepID=UPI0021E18011|nr:hypothetical protein [Thauera sp. Sel9]MCV2219153.1 hypothetical protein [Thauera sp. Sel9]
MSSNVAIQALEASLAGDSATPNMGASDRETYLQEQRTHLRKYIIEPVPVVAYANSWAQQYCGLGSGPYSMIAVAYCNDKVGQCLLYNPETGLFSLAYGHIDDPNGVGLVGYASNDALAEWLG